MQRSQLALPNPLRGGVSAGRGGVNPRNNYENCPPTRGMFP